MDWDEITHPEKYVDELFAKFKQIPFEEVLQFSESEVTDNSMPNREVLEDASKIHMLRDAIRNDNLHFLPSILHEPWYDRYRIHPGSGRAAALWLEGRNTLQGIYTHFVPGRREEIFRIPENSILVEKPTDMQSYIMLKDVYPDYETYHTFPKIAKECIKTINMDSEWHWHYIKCYAPYKFIRWSEGSNFLNYKTHWRSFAIDLYNELK